MAQKKRPVEEFRFGRINFSIWENQTEKGRVWFNLLIERLYLNGGKWKRSTSYGCNDLPIVSKGTDMAHAWMRAQERLALSELSTPEEQAAPADVADE